MQKNKRRPYRSKDDLFTKDLRRIRAHFTYYLTTKGGEDVKIMKDAKSKGLFSRLYAAYYAKWKAELEIRKIQKDYEELSELSKFKTIVRN